MGTTSRWIVVLCAAIAGGCGTASDRIDPRDLELRDLLGVAPETALAWDPAQRAAAREVLAGGLDQSGPAAIAPGDGRGRTFDERVARALAAIDRARAADGDDALGLVSVSGAAAGEGTREARGALDASRLEIAARTAAATAAALGAAAPAPARVELWLAEGWSAAPAWGDLPARGLDALSSIALEAGHRSGPVVVVPWPRLRVIASYAVADGRPPRLLVNPVLLASLEPAEPADLGAVAAMPRAPEEAAPPAAERAAPPRAGSDPVPELGSTTAASTAGNPYSFYGSIAECAYAQRTRCESCLGGGTPCTPITNISDGVEECNQLAAADGRGYFLLCINLGLSISSVDACTKDAAPGCPRDNDAASTLAELEANAGFLDDMTCGSALDGCLAEIYGPPPDGFPGPGPGTPPPPPRPPRETSIDCGDSCSSDNSNCEASPSCDCQGPSCSNSFSCDSACSSSNSGGGCGGGCDDGGGGGGGGGGGCSSDSGGGGGGGCSDDGGGGGGGGGGGCSDSGGGGGSCGGDSGGGSCGGDSGGGSCGGDSGGGSCGGDCGGGGGGGGGGGCSGGSCNSGGGSGCNVARRSPPPAAMWLVSIAWACLPLPIAALIRRRARARRAQAPDQDGAERDGGDGGGPRGDDGEPDGGDGGTPDGGERDEEVTS